MTGPRSPFEVGGRRLQPYELRLIRFRLIALGAFAGLVVIATLLIRHA